ncbi:winged helix-turn-helix domain-containing protein [Shewanella kaireitica]|uniref:winged helix-turn-helix domain-containing protein n=1 Tax=Shewanella kaireitica TaxID=212021 RepID=UPI00200E2C1F|nr:crosslink repair DNA glycosylase YcaQ family protein [Shewanella kaireitica]MCL1095598.1 winged helix DNA-binding domain-containing protein [Shewanella kaireitica]
MTSPYSPREWLQLNLQQQGLLKPAKSVVDAISQLSYVQIDSINVVERAHHHVLFNRLAEYQPSQLQLALANKDIFEYWSHAAAYLPINDYRFSLFNKTRIKQGGKHWFEPEHKVIREVKAKITAEGPLKASDFSHDSKANNSGWWDWKPAKRALEQLFMQGELMVLQRDKFQKVYDLTERVLPAHINSQAPTDDEFARYLIERYINAHGFGSQQQMLYLRKNIKPVLVRTLSEMYLAGELAQFTQAGVNYFYKPDQQLFSPILKRVWLLNPFDNLVIQRQRLKQLFGFDYQIEVYVPAAKRQYGYYSLPILWGDKFVGRVDVKAERKTGILLLQNLVIEDGTITSKGNSEFDEFIHQLKLAVNQYAAFNGCQRWQLVKSNHSAVEAELSFQANGMK